LAVSGEGRALRPAASAPAVETAATATVPVQANAYAVFLEGLLDALARQDWGSARNALQQASQTAPLAGQAALVKLDGECAALAERVPQAIPKGAALLTDGRDFTLMAVDGQSYEVGRNRKTQVAKATDSELEIKKSMGGGSMFFKLPFTALSPATRLELAQVGLSADAEGPLALAAYRLALLGRQASPADLKTLGQLLTAAARPGVPEERVNRLRAWLAFKLRESEARAALSTLEAALQKNDHQPAQEAFDRFRKDFADTAVFAGAIDRFPAMEKRIHELSTQIGLWGGCWKSDRENRFRERLFADVVVSIGWGQNVGPRNKRFPDDWFSLRYGGLLRIRKAGTYKFFLAADDRVRVWIDGKSIANNRSMELSEGDHAFKLEYEEDDRNDWLRLEWVTPGETEKVLIPSDVFFHLPGQREKYLE